ncbi:hypothetical protein GCM10028808_44440 [Spirosoma migulaei]
MSKPKMSTGSRRASCTRRSFSQGTKINNAPMVAEKPDSPVTIEVASLPSTTINFLQMAEDAAKMQEYIANGGKQSEASGVKFIKPSGLFNNWVGRR